MEPQSLLTPEQLEFSNAVSADEPEKVRAMLESGMNPNFRLSYGQTPLHNAVDSEIDWHEPNPTPPENGLVRLLLEYGANPNAMDRWGRTPLDWAANRRTVQWPDRPIVYIHKPGARALIEYGGKHGVALGAADSLW